MLGVLGVAPRPENRKTYARYIRGQIYRLGGAIRESTLEIWVTQHTPVTQVSKKADLRAFWPCFDSQFPYRPDGAAPTALAVAKALVGVRPERG